MQPQVMTKAITAEARAFADRHGAPPLDGTRDIRSLARAAERGRTLLASELIELRDTLSATNRTKRALSGGAGPSHWPRLADMAADNPYYYTRLESDRACALGMLVAYAPAVSPPPGPTTTFEASVRGAWCEPEHGAVMHRSPRRLASFSWRAFGIAQGMCQPPSDSHLTNWDQNLTGQVEFASSPYPFVAGVRPTSRRLVDCRIDSFAGGFVTSGTVIVAGDRSQGVDENAISIRPLLLERHASRASGPLVRGQQPARCRRCRNGRRRGTSSVSKLLRPLLRP